MHIESISNGLGAPSMFLLVLAAEGKIPATVSISADTGWERDRLWSDGTRASARVYFDQVVAPYAAQHGIDAAFTQALDGSGNPIPPLDQWMEQLIDEGKLTSIKIPMFGSQGGRLSQSCTQRKKVTAIRQELRRRGAKTARSAHGLHRGEFHRMKGRNQRVEAGFFTLTDMDADWVSHYYPLIDLGLFRADVDRELTQRGIPYLISSECDGCPHQDWPRWSRHSPESLAETARLEAKMNGEFFFTKYRVPLLDALELMRREHGAKQATGQSGMFDDPDFGCDEGGVCGV